MLAELTAQPATEPTTADLEREVWDTLVEAGRAARATGDDVKWTVGRLAVTAVKAFAVDKDGNPIDKKRKFVLKDFAVQIGMIDNPRMIYEYHDVCDYWSESAQAHFKDCTWSAFRETSRHGLPIDRASTIMHQHGHEPVGKIREVILGKPEPKAKPPEPIGEGAMPAAELFDLVGITWSDHSVRGHEMLRVVIYKVVQP